MVSIEDMKSAQDEQKKYWDYLKERMEFFLDDNTIVDIKVFDLPAIMENYIERNCCERALKDGYPIFARYWASRHISNHLDYLWLETYKADRLAQMPEKQASASADKVRKALRDLLLIEFP